MSINKPWIISIRRLVTAHIITDIFVSANRVFPVRKTENKMFPKGCFSAKKIAPAALKLA
jgi:hypothetical protein